MEGDQMSAPKRPWWDVLDGTDGELAAFLIGIAIGAWFGGCP